MKKEFNSEPSEASIAQVESTRRVVKAAIAKVLMEHVDSTGRIQAALEHTAAGKLFEVMIVDVEQTPNGVVLKGDLNAGLFINELNLDEAGAPVSRGLSIQTPRSQRAVNTISIYNLRRIAPETMDRLTIELKEAEKVSWIRYQEAMDELRGNNETTVQEGF